MRWLRVSISERKQQEKKVFSESRRCPVTQGLLTTIRDITSKELPGEYERSWARASPKLNTPPITAVLLEKHTKCQMKKLN